MNAPLLEEISAAFEEFDEESLREKVKAALTGGVDAVEILNCLTGLLEEIGEKFSKGEAFLPELVAAGDCMEVAVHILKPELVRNETYEPLGIKVIIGSVKGDIHTIGKNMVKMIMVAAGIEVIDLGIDVSPETFYYKALEVDPDIVALSSTMTTTIPSMKDTIDLFKSKGLDAKYKIIVGGGSVTEDIAANVGAYAYGGKDAYEGVKTVKAILGK